MGGVKREKTWREEGKEEEEVTLDDDSGLRGGRTRGGGVTILILTILIVAVTIKIYISRSGRRAAQERFPVADAGRRQ